MSVFKYYFMSYIIFSKISNCCFAFVSQIHNTNVIAIYFHVFLSFSLYDILSFFLSMRVARQSAPARFYSTKLTAFIQYPFSLTCVPLHVGICVLASAC